MALFNRREKTAREKANKAQLGILARLLGCAYLIYLVITMLRSSTENDGLNPTMKIVIAALMLTASVVIVIFTLLEFLRNVKSGFYKEDAYLSPEERAAYEAERESDTTDGETDVVDVEYSEVSEQNGDNLAPSSADNGAENE